MRKKPGKQVNFQTRRLCDAPAGDDPAGANDGSASDSGRQALERLEKMGTGGQLSRAARMIG